MKNILPPLTTYWSRCQTGLPVWLHCPPRRTPELRLGTPPAEVAAPLLYARYDRPTRRLLLHIVASGTTTANWRDRDQLLLPAGCRLSPAVARLLDGAGERTAIARGCYQLLDDGRFLTASVRLRTKTAAVVHALPETGFRSDKKAS